MINRKNIQPIILAGGSGTRLWPLSRENYPKQYIHLNSQTSFSFFQKTQQRLMSFQNIESPIIICNEEHRFIVAEQMREIKVKPKCIILEPCRRNTAPAIAVAAFRALQDDQESILLILSSDHEIKNNDNFINAVEKGLNDVRKDALITFGVKPTLPETGYGYIKIENQITETSFNSLPIKEFIEKPDLNKAEKIFKKDNYLWNSGIFLFKAKSIINELKKFEHKLIFNSQKSINNSKQDLDFLRLDEYFFSNCPNISIDIGVMEKTDKSRVIPLSAGWNDVGNWRALWNIENKNNEGNCIIGDVSTHNVRDSYIRSQNKLLVCVGLNNLIVVNTEDATLIANMNESQEIKNIVKKLNIEGRSECKIHRKVFRPWGYYKLIEKGITWQVKEICVNPKSSLSLQKHNQRSEHWIILKGIANVEIDDKKTVLYENQSTYIPLGNKHRLSNLEKTPLIIIEVQSGKYLGEDDIFRYDDNYGRHR